MSEKINELIKSVKDLKYDSSTGTFETDRRALFEFAELIVRECAKVAYKYAADSVNYEHYDDIGWDCLPVDLRSYIKEHFGVEE